MARRLYDEREKTVEEIGALLGVSRTSIYRSLRGDTTAPGPAVIAPAAARRVRRPAPRAEQRAGSPGADAG